MSRCIAKRPRARRTWIRLWDLIDRVRLPPNGVVAVRQDLLDCAYIEGLASGYREGYDACLADLGLPTSRWVSEGLERLEQLANNGGGQ